MTDENDVREIRPGASAQTPVEQPIHDPAWLAAADSFRGDFEAETGRPAVLDSATDYRKGPPAEGVPATDYFNYQQRGASPEQETSMSDTTGIHDDTHPKGAIPWSGPAPGDEPVPGLAESVEAAATAEREPGDTRGMRQVLETPAKTRKATQHEREMEEIRLAEEKGTAQREAAKRARIQGKADAEFEKRAPLFDPQRTFVMVTAVILALIIFLTSGIFSYFTVAAVAEEMHPVQAWLAFLVPGFIEVFTVFFGLDSLINSARGRKHDASVALRWMLWITGIAAFIAVVYSLRANADLLPFVPPAAYDIMLVVTGIVVMGLAPMAVVLVTKRVQRLVFIEDGQAV